MMTAVEMVDEVRNLVQDRSSLRWSDSEIISLLARIKVRLFANAALTPEQEEALTIVAAFRLLQARDAAVQLEAMATSHG